MGYDADVGSIECPKCGHGMEEVSYGGDVLIDRCSSCQGLWFDQGEADLLTGKWMRDALETGAAGKGKKWKSVGDIDCPRCGQQMEKAADPDQPHIWYEVCKDHGMFMDAEEFSEFKQETLSDWFRSLIKGLRI